MNSAASKKNQSTNLVGQKRAKFDHEEGEEGGEKSERKVPRVAEVDAFKLE